MPTATSDLDGRVVEASELRTTAERLLGVKLDSRPGGVAEYDFSEVSVVASKACPCVWPVAWLAAGLRTSQIVRNAAF